MDWSDHAMWWPEHNIWLDKTRWTLDQYNITADAVIQFTPMHKTLRIQLPDLRYIDCNVDFSIRTFTAIFNVCSELGKSLFITYPWRINCSAFFMALHWLNYIQFLLQVSNINEALLPEVPF